MPPSSSATAPDPAAAPGLGGPGRPGRLRDITGGYDIGRLPLVVAPIPGEQPASWLARWAYRYRVPVSGLLVELGVGITASPAAVAEARLARHADLIAAAAGLTPAPPASGNDAAWALAAQVARYLGCYHGRGPGAPARARFCPSCLAEPRGAWQRAWAAPLHVVCTRHGVLLVSRCPRCRRGRFTSSAWMSHDTPPWMCSERAPGPHTPRTRYQVCGQDLRDAPAQPVDNETSRLQDWVLELATRAGCDPAGTSRVCGFDTSHRDLFDAVLELAVEHLDGTDHLTRSDRSPEPLLTAVRAAREVLTQPDAECAAGIADRYRLLHPAGPVTPLGPDHVLNRRRRNRLLAAIRLTSLAERLPAGSQLVFRTGSGRPRYPRPPRAGEVTSAPGPTLLAWIPQLLWPGALGPWIAEDYRDQAAASMLLAKVGSTRPWRLIAIDLGLPASFALDPPNLIRHLRHVDAWPGVLARLDDLATTLEATPPPINYQARRWAAADQALLVAAVNHTRDLLGPVHGWVSTHLLVELFWQVYTAGDLRLAAPTEGTLLNPDLYHHDGDSAHLDPLTDPVLTRFLTTVAARVAEATGQQDEPLTWQPP